jgi:protein-tyrosine phosphatase
MNNMAERRLLWDACYNVRDLGDFTTQDNQQTRWQAFVRADNLARLSPIGQKAVIDYGVKTIIDLRSDYELDIDPPSFALLSEQSDYPYYVNLPLLNESDKEGIQLIDQSQSLSEMYRLIVDRFQENIAVILKACAARSMNGTILFHCHSGRDRTGLIAAILLVLAGVDHLTIAKDYALSNVYIQPTYEKSLTEQPEIMLDLLAYLDTQYGGVRAYLLNGGVTAQELSYIQAFLLG